MAGHLETEIKFELEKHGSVPPLEGLVPLGAVHDFRQRSVYYDTVDLLLTRHSITLRRRTGGSDDGWHLKLPVGPRSRKEVHADLEDAPGHLRVPTVLRAAVAAALGAGRPADPDDALVPLSFLATHRTETELLGPEGAVLAGLSDDRVSALPSGLSMREVEVELLDGDEELLAAVEERFAEHGVQRSSSPSKVVWSLGSLPRRVEKGRGPRRSGPAAVLVHSYLRREVAAVVGREEAMRADEEDAVHQGRLAVRRLRGALRTFRRLFRRELSDPLRDELSWLGDILGAPRDAEVMLERLGGELDELPADLVRGPVHERLRHEVGTRHDSGHDALVAALNSERYLALVDSLLDFLGDTPWRGRAAKPARRVLPPLIRTAVRRAGRGRDAAAHAEGDAQLHLLHEARKRAKAVRYAYEAVAPSFGDRAGESAAEWEAATDALGLLQDSSVATRWLTEVAAAAEAAGEPSFTYGVLAGIEYARQSGDLGEEGERALDRALRR
ncbi:CYTH and CHAD domain-containing protein [Tessaracoccus sp. MC1865]|uniref:CYTH and CHAD domain-containing protein n=1 Tax=Tessaracoccus sp. MC1865 TaxID=2760310 RepID=UPI001603269B|nr:CYTH and CHAD domain-containing protein [Tessaracoccus sp. MC1865]MBB1483858.1 CYTH and CHAD domain-containing protein [Tessaracoccus sp. MC1865]QTO36913.1 CYTH and CHAD domain-containing protein [Tessaracoccus sp. MC1865]